MLLCLDLDDLEFLHQHWESKQDTLSEIRKNLDVTLKILESESMMILDSKRYYWSEMFGNSLIFSPLLNDADKSFQLPLGEDGVQILTPDWGFLTCCQAI